MELIGSCEGMPVSLKAARGACNGPSEELFQMVTKYKIFKWPRHDKIQRFFPSYNSFALKILLKKDNEKNEEILQ